MDELICIRKYKHAEEAEAVRKLLEVGGVECYVQSEEGGSMTPETVAQSCIMVRAEDLQKASDVLDSGEGLDKAI